MCEEGVLCVCEEGVLCVCEEGVLWCRGVQIVVVCVRRVCCVLGGCVVV